MNAYSMSMNYGEKKGNSGGELVPIAGDDVTSKDLVIKLACKMGFQGVDIGPLRNSLQLELQNKKTFQDWFFPVIITAIFVLFNYIWVFFMYFYFPKKPHTFEKVYSIIRTKFFYYVIKKFICLQSFDLISIRF